MQLAGKRTIITGAASGMGKAGLELFAREGAQILAVDIDGAALEQVVAGLEPDVAARIQTLAADLSTPDMAEQMVATALERLGSIDILWSHAGINGPTDLDALDMELYDRSLGLNLTAAIVACGKVVPVMRAQKSGAILLTSSIAGLVGSIQSPVYSATKFGLVGFAKSLALREAAEGIRVNALCPGPVDSAMVRNLIAGNDTVKNGEEVGQKWLASIPMGRFGRPEELAAAALFLCSDAASFITGVALPVDGGLTAR